DSDHVLGWHRRAILAGHAESLEVTIFALRAGERPQAETLEAFRDIARRRIKAAAAGAAPFALGRRQPFDIGLHAGSVKQRLDLGERLARREFDRLRLWREIARERCVTHWPFAGRLVGGVVAGKYQPGIFAVVRELARKRLGRRLA